MLMSEENNTTFRFKLASTKIPLWADKEKIETVLRNIISNAFKFTPAGGSITVSTGMDPNGKKCFVQVDDTGAGIPQNKINDIFDRFVQADNQGSHYYQGTGIGLALSKEIMNLHHGNISAENKTGGKGSVFTIELLMGKSHFSEKEVDFYVGEIVDSTKSSEDPLFEKTSETENFKTHLPLLLVVEDNPGLCDLLRMQLEDRYNVLTAQNGAEGMKKVNRYHPDIVVTDQMMPEMSGNELLQNIRNDFRISHTPVIILTAKTGEDEKLKSVTLGANAYITKPFNKEYLIARIDQLLNERKEFRKKIQYSLALHPASENDEGVYEKYLIDKDIQMLNKINQMIEQNLDDSNYSIDALAEDLGLSRSAFFKKVKSLTGFAPVDLIKEIRLNKSVELIKTTDLSVSEITFTVGFKEAGYFGKCFRKKYQCTPTEYIEQYRNTQTQAD
jgi:DNA-binding response OmpR family regulator